jgi:hypothetical protein
MTYQQYRNWIDLGLGLVTAWIACLCSIINAMEWV